MKLLSIFFIFSIFSCSYDYSDSSADASDRVYELRDTGPSGGYIFYVEEDEELIESRGWKYLEAASEDVSLGINLLWQSPTEIIGTDVQATSLGTGKTNTDMAVEWLLDNYQTYRAAQVCDDYSSNIYYDWFLPSKDELFYIAWNLEGIKQEFVDGIGDQTIFNEDFEGSIGHFQDALYWSSSETATNHVWMQSFINGAQNYYAKTYSGRVRCIRAFK